MHAPLRDAGDPTPGSEAPEVPSIGAILAVAALYTLLGRAALLLAIPPGIVAPFWPSAGLALAATLRWGPRMLLGVFLGSFAINAGMVIESDLPEVLSSLVVCTTLASGAVVRAWLGATLVRRTCRSLALVHVRDVGRFFLFGGPVACLVPATIGVCALTFTGTISSAEVLYSWFTFWVGDTAGVIAVAPIAMIALGRPRAQWRVRVRRVGIPLATAMVVVIAIFAFARSWEIESAETRFQREIRRSTWALEKDARTYASTLQSIERYFASSTFVDDDEFRTYVTGLIRDHEGVRALEWVPRVPAADRAAYERGDLIPGVRQPIRERSDGWPLAPATERADYYPVTYIEPRLGNEQALGYDLGSSDDRRRAIERARDAGTVVGTAPLQMLLESGDRTGFLLLHPVYSTPNIPVSIAERRAHFVGVVGGVFLADEFANAALAEISSPSIHGRVVDRLTGVALFEFGAAAPAGGETALHEVPVDFLGREWSIEYTMGDGFRAASRSLNSWIVLVTGLAVVALLASFLLVLDSTIGQVEEKVQERTWQLALIVEDLKNARVAADDANRVKSEFIANMSHEIRTPLTAILGFGETLRESGLTHQERLDAIDAIVGNGQHLLQLINDILDISKIEAGKLETETLEVDLTQLVRRTAALIDGKMREKEIDFRVEYITSVPRSIRTDPTRVQQMLINLLGNSIKFSPSQSTILVTIALSELETTVGPEPALDFCVFDSGIGMSKTQLSRLFRPFTQADASMSRRFGGTGLGLTITRQLCEILGGEVVVTSEEGRGTAFRLTIPTGPIDGVPMIDPEVDPVHSTLEKSGSEAKRHETRERVADRIAARILLAEDGIDNQKLLRFVLERAGCSVDIAEHGGIAWTMLQEAEEAGTPYDLLLTDMQMPEMDGYELVTRLRADGCVLPIIALTASAMRGDRDRCLAIGCDDYASKPIDRRALIEAIRGQLQRVDERQHG